MSIEYIQKYVVLVVGKEPKLPFVDAGLLMSPNDITNEPKIIFRGEKLELFNSLDSVQTALKETNKYQKDRKYNWDKLFYQQIVPVMIPVEKTKKKKKKARNK
jgi:hypothetical protein